MNKNYLQWLLLTVIQESPSSKTQFLGQKCLNVEWYYSVDYLFASMSRMIEKYKRQKNQHFH